jgi:hypothetical protein
MLRSVSVPGGGEHKVRYPPRDLNHVQRNDTVLMTATVRTVNKVKAQLCRDRT